MGKGAVKVLRGCPETFSSRFIGRDGRYLAQISTLRTPYQFFNEPNSPSLLRALVLTILRDLDYLLKVPTSSLLRTHVPSYSCVEKGREAVREGTSPDRNSLLVLAEPLSLQHQNVSSPDRRTMRVGRGWRHHLLANCTNSQGWPWS